jgi:hypothetical protein
MEKVKLPTDSAHQYKMHMLRRTLFKRINR